MKINELSEKIPPEILKMTSLSQLKKFKALTKIRSDPIHVQNFWQIEEGDREIWVKYILEGKMRRKITFVGSIGATLVIVVVTMAIVISLARSFHRPLCTSSTTKHLLKSRICPLWSPSFFLCLPTTPRTTLLRHSPAAAPRRASFCSATLPSSMTTVADENPLLKDFEFPPFDVIDASHVRPGMRALLNKLDSDLAELEKNVEPSWPKLVEPLEKMMDRLSVVWGAINHLKAVKDTPELRSAIEEIQAIRESPDWAKLSDAQKRIVECKYLELSLRVVEAVLSGVSLEDSKREEFNQIQQDLAMLSRRFDENVLDATKAFSKLITDKKEVEGLPASALGLAAQTAVSKGHEKATPEDGPWMITLDAPSYMAVMQHAKNRALREELYCAYVTRASSGDLDNTPVIEQILKLRLEKAKLLGYNNYAEVSMATKMATVSKAEELLEKLRTASWNAAVQDMEDLKQFCKSQGAPEADVLTHWDLPFWSERLRESKYEINEEDLRPYFSLPKVMDGLFSLVKMLFGIDVEAADGLVPVWNSDVRFYLIKDLTGKPISYFYFDPYSRPEEKRGGAWMDEVVARSRLLSNDKNSARLPVAHMVCNQMPPVGDKPSLMTFREVETVFHEFGHSLQHMLTKQDEGLVAGIRGIEWDAVELPSQFMENWCYHRDTLMSIAKHYETGETLPEEIYQKLLAARTFRAGSLSLRQLKFAGVDLELHSKYVPGGSESIYDVDRRVSERTQWAEVLSADAFSAFEDAGLNNDKAVRETGKRFRETILALGGGKAPLDVFVEFRGREPSPEPLLRHNGLLHAAA
ncbi:hypothetical protein LXL04_013670 [Taraxacum kok-saghyz]